MKRKDAVAILTEFLDELESLRDQVHGAEWDTTLLERIDAIDYAIKKLTEKKGKER